MLNAFDMNLDGEQSKTVDFLDKSAFDEKFEVDCEADYIRNIYHVENKYYVPVLNGSYSQMFEYAKQHMIYPADRKFHAMLDPDNLMERFAASETPGMLKSECREKLVDGTYRWVQYIGIAGEEHGVPDGKAHFYVFDIQNQVDRDQGRVTVAHSHPKRNELTGLLVREAFLPAAAKLAASGPGPWCCVAVDIQNFKVFNAWYGEEEGDYVLSRIGLFLTGFEQENNAVAAYFGRDNFAVFMSHSRAKLDQLFDGIRDVFLARGGAGGFLPALGVNLMEEGDAIAFDLYDKARMAVADAKKDYTDRIRYFDEYKFDRRRRDLEMLADFQVALAQGEIGFVLQPQCSIETGKIVGAEALARWVKENGTVVSPGAFIPFLESSGFITELDKVVWESVMPWIRSVLDRGMDPVPVSVNVSQADLLSMDVAAYLYGLAQRFRVPTRLLKVEITESFCAENDQAADEAIAALKAKGFSVLMDDFGAGYSSLGMLGKLEVDVLKLDMAFMGGHDGPSKRGISIVEAIVGMTKALGVPVVVEGVETSDQVAFLKGMGCKYAQGYHFYRPMAVPDFEALLGEPANVDFGGFKGRSTDLFHVREFLNETLFTNTMVNHIIGAVAYYTLDGRDLTISRYNEQFRHAIGDPNMDSRRISIQNYVVREDWPHLYRALDEACAHVDQGGTCEVRFYKSDQSVFLFRMRFFFLREDDGKKVFCGQVQDITENRDQTIRFLEMLRKQAAVTMRINLNQGTVGYASGNNTLYEPELPSISLDESVRRTAETRLANDKDRAVFKEFYDKDRLMAVFQKAVYHEELVLDFKLVDEFVPVRFATYIIRMSKDQDVILYSFAMPL